MTPIDDEDCYCCAVCERVFPTVFYDKPELEVQEGMDGTYYCGQACEFKVIMQDLEAFLEHPNTFTPAWAALLVKRVKYFHESIGDVVMDTFHDERS